MTNQAKSIRSIFTSSPITKEEISRAYAMGMIPRDHLEHGEYYTGICRNAEVAMWRADEGRFFHLRTKYGTTYAEAINHPEDDNGFDFFVPVAHVILPGASTARPPGYEEFKKTGPPRGPWNQPQPRPRAERLLQAILSVYGIDDIKENPTAKGWADQILNALKGLEELAKSQEYNKDEN
jgi:hypothetical protein